PCLLTRYDSGDYRVSRRLRAHDSKTNQLDLGIMRKPKEDPAVSNEHETWIRLIDNVGSLQIRYFDSRLNTWVQRWVDTVTLPRLVKIVIGRSDASAPAEIIVPLARTPLRAGQNRAAPPYCCHSGRSFCLGHWSCHGRSISIRALPFLAPKIVLSKQKRWRHRVPKLPCIRPLDQDHEISRANSVMVKPTVRD